MEQPYVRKVKDHFDKLKAERQTWNPMFQALGEYISLIKQNFEGQPSNGDFLMNEIFDTTGAYAAMNSSSALSGMLWAGSAKQSIFIEEPRDLKTNKRIAEYYDYFSTKLTDAFDDPRANFAIAFDEYMLDQSIFGTSGIGVESGTESELLFKPYGVKEMFIDEGKNGVVDEVYLFFEWTVGRIVDEYGIEAVSEQVRKLHKDGKITDKKKVLIAIRPRKDFKATKGKLAMPYESVHIEYDTCHLLRESGYSELPIKVGRYRKLNYERYGRSNGMFALPDIKEANVLREAVIVATEKNLDPPLGVFNEGILGGGTVDTSSGAISVFNASAQIGGGNPVFPLVTVGSLSDALVRLEKLEQTIAQHFNIDRLLDFNNETQMTFGEAQIRAGLRNASLSSLFSRQISEVLSPVIERATNILFQKGELGVVEGSDMHLERMASGKEFHIIPEELVARLDAGQEIYRIGYRTQAANASRSDEYLAILDIASTAIQFGQVDQKAGMRVNFDQAIKELGEIRGLSSKVLREDDEIEAMLQAQAEQEQMMQTMAMAEQGAGIVDKLASASNTARIE